MRAVLTVLALFSSKATSGFSNSHDSAALLFSDQCVDDNPVLQPYSDQFNYDQMIVVSNELKIKGKASPLANKYIELVKVVLNEILENNMVFCKLQMIRAMPEKDIKKILAPFVFEIYKRPSSNTDRAQMHFNPKKENKIKIPAIPFKANEYLDIKDDLTIAIIHEIQHAFAQANNIGTRDSRDAERVSGLFKQLQAGSLTKAEIQTAPYATKKEKQQFSTILKKGLNKTDKLIAQWIAVREKNADGATNLLIENFKKLTKGFSEGKMLAVNAKYGYCPLKEILESIKDGATTSEKRYESDRHLLEADAFFHQYLTVYPELFEYLFKELLEWHASHAPEYKECMLKRAR